VTGPRILAIMGSGEIAPTMAKVHRSLFERFGTGAATGATLIDTPYGFQENADELTERIVEHFQVNIGRSMTVASYRSSDTGPAAAAAAVGRIAEAGYVLSGPGSPSYALRHWLGGPIPGTLQAKLASGGIVTMASAAALTLGLVTIPVYEIYKVGDRPTWLDGLDLLGPATGLKAAVVPHYDNAEGGTHDTRFCYIGERRLRVLERALPRGAFVLGVDSHTALVFDLDARTASVRGLGGVTVRVQGRSRAFAHGTETTIDELAETVRELRAARSARSTAGRSTAATGPDGTGRAAGETPETRAADGPGPVRDEVAQLEGTFVASLGSGDVRAAVGALIALDQAIERRVGAGEESPDLQAARATFRSLIVRLGDASGGPATDSREAIEPFVEALVELRGRARASGDWAAADLVRDRLAEAGIDVHDGPDGTSWTVRGTESR